MAPILKLFAFFLASAVALPQDHNNNILERRMTYRNNEVTINNNLQDGKILSASFTIHQLSITDGQDPDARNRINEFKESYTVDNRQRGFRFDVGRKKSSKVANFWSSQISPVQNTFGHNPDGLNFAFIGELKIEIPYPNKVSNFVWHGVDIAIGQGSAGASNNWWFGGKNCKSDVDGGHEVWCQGMNLDTNRKVDLLFRRGGTPEVNRIDINNIIYHPIGS